MHGGSSWFKNGNAVDFGYHSSYSWFFNFELYILLEILKSWTKFNFKRRKGCNHNQRHCLFYSWNDHNFYSFFVQSNRKNKINFNHRIFYYFDSCNYICLFSFNLLQHVQHGRTDLLRVFQIQALCFKSQRNL